MNHTFVRKTLFALSVLFGISVVTFLLFHVVGGDPALAVAGEAADADELIRLRSELGLDRPLWTQLGAHLRDVATFSFGRSIATGEKVSDLFLSGAGISFCLTFPPFLISAFLSIALGLWSAFRKSTKIDRIISGCALFSMSISSVAVVLVGQYVFAFRLGLFPIFGFERDLVGAATHLALPWLLWTLVSLGPDLRIFRTLFLEELEQDYVRTAFAKGASSQRVLFVHLLRGALPGILTRLITQIPFLFLGSMLLESFFGIPGLGSVVVGALGSADWPIVRAATILGSIFFLAGTLLTDLLCAKADPRMRFS